MANNPLAQIVQNEARNNTTASSPLSSGNNSTPTQYNAFTSNNVGGVGISYGKASGDMIGSAQQSNPILATALQNGTAQYNVDDTGNGYLVDTSTGQPIGGNYTVSSTPSGQTAINIPLNNGGMLQAIAGTDPNGNGMLSPVSANNVFNVGLNAGAKGFAGGISQPVASFSPMLAMNPVTAPFLAAYNVANDVASGHVNANTLLNGFNAYMGLTGPSPTLVDQIPSADGTTMTNVYQDASGNITQKVVDASSISQGSSSNLFSPQNVANVKGALNFTNSVANNNPLGIISSGLGLASNNGITVDPNINTALTVGTFIKNLESGNISGMINNAMSLAKSSNPTIASSAQKVVDASTSGDQNAVVTASTELGKVLNSDSTSASTGNEYDIFNHDPNMVNASLSLAKPPGSQDTQTMNMYDQINKALSLTRAPDNAIISDLKTIFSESGDLDEDGNPILDKTTQVVVKVPIENGKFSGYTINYDPTSNSISYEYYTPVGDPLKGKEDIYVSKNPPVYDPETNKFLPPTKEPIADNTSQQTLPTDNTEKVDSPLVNSGITPNATVDVNSKVNSPLVTDKPISNTVVPDIVSPFATQSGSSGASKVPSNNSGPLGSNATSANTTSPNGTSPLGGGIVSNTNPNYNNFGVAPTASPTPNGISTPSPLAPNGTPNGTPNATPVAPTATPVAPTPTPTSTPTPTPSPTPTPTSSPTPTPTPTPSQSLGLTSGAPTNSALAMVATMLAGAPMYGEKAQLQKLKQLYDSLDPGLAKILANEGIKAPQEPKQQEQ